MRFVLFILSLFCFIGGMTSPLTGIGLLAGGISLLSAAVLFSGACILDALIIWQKRLDKRLEEMAGDALKIRYQVEKLTRE